MPLFTDNLPRSAFVAFGAFVVSYYLGSFINSSSAFQFTQTALALLAIAAIIIFVVLHHRSEGRLFTQSQEEVLLIAGTALIGFALWIAFRQWARAPIPVSRVPEPAGTTVPQVDVRTPNRGSNRKAGQWREDPPYPCSKDDIYCIVEEYSYYW